MFKRLVSTAVVFGMAALAPPAFAQSACSDRDHIVRKLETGFDERLSALGFRSEKEVVEIWSSGSAGTWTILLTRANGISCIIASGTQWASRFATDEASEPPAF